VNQIKEQPLIYYYPLNLLKTLVFKGFFKIHTDLYTVSRLLGHSDVVTTQRYVNTTEDKVIIKRGMNSPFVQLKTQYPQLRKCQIAPTFNRMGARSIILVLHFETNFFKT
jgi:hypothetical protein